MKCPFCSSSDVKVVDSRLAEEGSAIRRRRECEACSRRFTTFERIESVALMVTKRDGTLQPFSSEKLARGIALACEKRGLAPEAIDSMTADIEDALRKEGEVITSEAIGLMVLKKLRETDDVAYLRFASVYKDFQDASEFGREVGSLMAGRDGRVVLQKRRATDAVTGAG